MEKRKSKKGKTPRKDKVFRIEVSLNWVIYEVYTQKKKLSMNQQGER